MDKLKRLGWWLAFKSIDVFFDVMTVGVNFFFAWVLAYHSSWLHHFDPEKSFPYFLAIFFYLDLRRAIRKDDPCSPK